MTTTMEMSPMTENTVEEQEPFTWALTAGEYAATVEKIAKINARAEKRGFTGRLVVEGERTEVTRTHPFTGIETTEIVYQTRITGDAPSYNGYRFLARIDRMGDTFTIATAPGVEHVDRSLVHAGQCDHCGHNRSRNNTYLVQNVETGETLNVGSTCIKDFLGWSASVVFFSEGDVASDLDGLGFGGGNYDRQYSVDTVLALALAATKAFGWVRSGDYNARPTADWVRLGLGILRPTKHDEQDMRLMRAYADEANEKAAAIRAWILSDEFSGNSTYVDNLKVAAGVEGVGSRQIGLLASGPQAYVRFLETAAEREAKQAAWAAEKEAKKASDFIAEIGTKKVLVEGTISAIRYIPGDYGTTTLYTVLTKDGNLVKWFSSNGALGDTEGVEVKFHGTVKSHDEYQGVKATVLTRCKVVE